ncbi:MAG: four helix bundle protein [Planctomycetaceae bacterium]|nr:MAG: four helix bundle protein [Planctomycetaceae bacterium]
MTYHRFEDLPVWSAAADLAATMFAWSNQPVFRRKGDLANQLQRATLSISNNIAEGFERGTTSELLTFLYYARGSAGEVRSMLCVIDRMPEFLNFKSEIPDLKSQAESISRQIRGWANSLQNSEITGQRHLNDRTRQSYERQKKESAFLEQQRQFKLQHEARLNEAARRRNQQSADSDSNDETEGA